MRTRQVMVCVVPMKQRTMTIGILSAVVLVACKSEGDPAATTSTKKVAETPAIPAEPPSAKPAETPAVPAPIVAEQTIDAASVNALVPASLKKQLTFEKLDVARKSPGRDVTYSVLAPKTWSDANLFFPTIRPSGKDLADSNLVIESKCDGSCVGQDWNEVSERFDFKPLRDKTIEKEERGKTSHLLIASEAGVRYVVYAWWAEGGTIYHHCTATLQKRIMEAAPAFEQACKAIKINGRF